MEMAEFVDVVAEESPGHVRYIQVSLSFSHIIHLCPHLSSPLPQATATEDTASSTALSKVCSLYPFSSLPCNLIGVSVVTRLPVGYSYQDARPNDSPEEHPEAALIGGMYMVIIASITVSACSLSLMYTCYRLATMTPSFTEEAPLLNCELTTPPLSIM